MLDCLRPHHLFWIDAGYVDLLRWQCITSVYNVKHDSFQEVQKIRAHSPYCTICPCPHLFQISVSLRNLPNGFIHLLAIIARSWSDWHIGEYHFKCATSSPTAEISRFTWTLIIEIYLCAFIDRACSRNRSLSGLAVSMASRINIKLLSNSK